MAERIQNVVVLGSTGTIGRNTLDVVARFPERFRVLALTANNNIDLLQEQILRFRPRYVVAGEKNSAQLKSVCSKGRVRLLTGRAGLCQVAALPPADAIVIGISGSVALEPFLSAVRAGKRVAPANKEALVIAGPLIMAAAKRSGAAIIPVDSEQSAIFQCLQGQRRGDVQKIYLTASGGALANIPSSRFDKLTVRQILRHPRWRMGKKITVDSATLMNKGFEVIEACRLFELAVDQIEVVVHPEAIIHSMVGFTDGSTIAQLAVPDMRLPIQYALTYPQRLPSNLPEVDFRKLRKLTFYSPDFKKFPCLDLAITVARKDGTLPAVLNAADQQAVQAFLDGEIRFSDIYPVVVRVVEKHRSIRNPGLPEIVASENWANAVAREVIRKKRI